MINDLLDDARFSEDGKKRLLTHWLNNDLSFADKDEVNTLTTTLQGRKDDDFYSAALNRLEKDTTSKG